MIPTETELLRRCAETESRIVSTGDLTELQIASARADGTMYVSPDGFGFVLLPWSLSTVKDLERERDTITRTRRPEWLASNNTRPDTDTA